MPRLSGSPPPLPLRLVIQSGLRGALLLARGRADGLLLMEATPDGAARSFWSAVVCLPGFLALRLLAWSSGDAPATGPLLGLVAELIGYVCAWAGFALASLPLAEASGRRAEWPRFIAAWNWGNAVQYLVLLALTVPAGLGLPPLLAHGLGLAGIGYALWLEWFITRTALNITGGAAAGFVVLDLMLGMVIGGLVGRLTQLQSIASG
ncbi:hypothetical protein JMJ55_10990 [Belnapia sp. T6]|uniref:Yip1 domain-containing protein n=1 Tax=Belnapia mucosa TaxID=2804532 RepID=A0ABS1V2C2_9PROT|nr:hypothetical protein [Belnapia mucosa]MBL6455849.1 hypothetical protein [Belnapia mucosa]